MKEVNFILEKKNGKLLTGKPMITHVNYYQFNIFLIQSCIKFLLTPIEININLCQYKCKLLWAEFMSIL